MLLKVSSVDAGYNKKLVLNKASLEVEKGEIVGLIGANGAGKSTMLKVIFGFLRTWSGTIVYKDQQIQNRDPLLNIKDGMVFSPQGNRVFDELTVLENLEIGGYILREKEEISLRIRRIFELFPILEERRSQSAGQLSGGEKQMLALGRALMLSPDLLLLDEPSLGLSPKLVKEALQRIKDVNRNFGTTVLIVEQKVKDLLNIVDRVYAMKLGRIIWQDIPENLSPNGKLKEIYLTR
jgi:branched-chain amino acid transport system ATP-binding protein